MKESFATISKRAMNHLKEDEAKLNDMMSRVKPLLSDGQIDRASQEVKNVYQYSWPDELVGLFKQFPPVEVCAECGATKQSIWEYGNTWDFVPCQECNKRDLHNNIAAAMNRRLLKRGLPSMFLSANLDQFPKPIQRVVSKGGGLYITGGCGIGKTHLLAAIMRKYAHDNALRCIKDNNEGSPIVRYEESPTAWYPLFASLSEILLSIRQTFNNHSEQSEDSIITKHTNIDVLLLDDVGVEKPTDWALQTIYLIIDRRYRDMKTTYFSSNYTLGQLAKRLGDRITSRISGMTEVIKLKGEDRRLGG